MIFSLRPGSRREELPKNYNFLPMDFVSWNINHYEQLHLKVYNSVHRNSCLVYLILISVYHFVTNLSHKEGWRWFVTLNQNDIYKGWIDSFVVLPLTLTNYLHIANVFFQVVVSIALNKQRTKIVKTSNKKS